MAKENLTKRKNRYFFILFLISSIPQSYKKVDVLGEEKQIQLSKHANFQTGFSYKVQPKVVVHGFSTSADE